MEWRLCWRRPFVRHRVRLQGWDGLVSFALLRPAGVNSSAGYDFDGCCVATDLFGLLSRACLLSTVHFSRLLPCCIASCLVVGCVVWPSSSFPVARASTVVVRPR